MAKIQEPITERPCPVCSGDVVRNSGGRRVSCKRCGLSGRVENWWELHKLRRSSDLARAKNLRIHMTAKELKVIANNLEGEENASD